MTLRHPYTKIGVKIWSAVSFGLGGFLMTFGSVLVFFGSLLEGSDFGSLDLEKLILGLIFLITGVILYIGANEYITPDEESLKTEDHLMSP